MSRSSAACTRSGTYVGDTTVSQGVIPYARTVHTGLDHRSVVMLKIQNGNWTLLPN